MNFHGKRFAQALVLQMETQTVDVKLKVCIMRQAAHQASTDKNNLTKKNLLSSRGVFTMPYYKALDINIEARVKPPEVIWHQTIRRNWL